MLPLGDRSCQVGDESESMCMGGGGGEPPPSDRDEVSTDERKLNSLSCCSRENDADDRPPLSEKSSVRSEFIDVMRPILPAYVLVLCRARVGPGSLSTVANEMTDMPLGKSDDDIEWSSSNSRRRAFDIRSSSDRRQCVPSLWANEDAPPITSDCELAPWL